eukprot:CAMPEP_0197889820 /NCGR_PEP_ID=MMETSP1439-20131203/24540_1 /TAXON_ID=66791 /ORGANISM="Gonyaulax spinifera, Strain CCMP409" /LENGTH=279 /DNA_ID=CAMNT_0043509807 /DNA_START=52 /DNA_END=890 /DNA_ORIENTATION=+
MAQVTAVPQSFRQAPQPSPRLLQARVTELERLNAEMQSSGESNRRKAKELQTANAVLQGQLEGGEQFLKELADQNQRLLGQLSEQAYEAQVARHEADALRQQLAEQGRDLGQRLAVAEQERDRTMQAMADEGLELQGRIQQLEHELGVMSRHLSAVTPLAMVPPSPVRTAAAPAPAAPQTPKAVRRTRMPSSSPSIGSLQSPQSPKGLKEAPATAAWLCQPPARSAAPPVAHQAVHLSCPLVQSLVAEETIASLVADVPLVARLWLLITKDLGMCDGEL